MLRLDRQINSKYTSNLQIKVAVPHLLRDVEIFFNKTQPSGFFFRFYWDFIGFYCFFLGFTKFGYAQPQYQVQLRAKVVISPFSIAVPMSVGAKMVVILTFLATHPNRLGFALTQQEHQCKVSLTYQLGLKSIYEHQRIGNRTSFFFQLIRSHHPTSPTTTSLVKFRLDLKQGKPQKESSLSRLGQLTIAVEP